MREIPDQIQNQNDFDLCRNTETLIYVYSLNDLQNHIDSGFITGGGGNLDFIEINNNAYSTSEYVFMTEA